MDVAWAAVGNSEFRNANLPAECLFTFLLIDLLDVVSWDVIWVIDEAEELLIVFCSDGAVIGWQVFADFGCC